MASPDHHIHVKSGLQQRVEDLTSQLQEDVSKAKLSHEAALLSLTSDCSNALKDLSALFADRLQAMQNIHRENILKIEEEISYLKEIATSQHILLQNNLEYIKELEERYVIKPKETEE